MEEEVGVKAPVTRLRRRISIEQSDDGKSSPAPGTPTKKRGVRKAAKPELDLIDENVAENSFKKTTRKTAVKEIKDNVDEKPVTPSRRSARIKSNTSIISDTLPNFDSPRGKRAARRNSQAGSDTEIPLTPIRPTRRTRKDSSSSVEKEDAASTNSKITSQIPEAILEEPESNTKTNNDEVKHSEGENIKQSPIRKSPRLLNKTPRSSNSPVPMLSETKTSAVTADDAINIVKSTKSEDSSTTSLDNENSVPNNGKSDNATKTKRLSNSSINLIKNLDTKPKKTFSHINKSLTDAQELNKIKTKRHRTKSWTTIPAISLTNEEFYSDNEKKKKKRQHDSNNIFVKKTVDSGSGDKEINSSKSENKGNEDNILQNDSNTSRNLSKKKNKDKSNSSLTYSSNKSSNENDPTIQNDGEITNLFKKDPSHNIQTTVLIEDSDSNPIQINNENSNEDQCVPVINHKLGEKSDNLSNSALSTSYKNEKTDIMEFKKNSSSDTCEPMDVDETLPENLINNLPVEAQDNIMNKSQESNIKNISNNSKTKISANLSTTQPLEKSSKENKSTLILSQLKDLSTSNNNSPQVSTNKQLCKSINVSDITQDNSKRNKKLSPNYLTSTPLQQKNDSKQSNKNSNIFDDKITKQTNQNNTKKDECDISNTSIHSSAKDSVSEEESTTSDKNNFFEDEAEEANDSYESGDSQNEEEKQYEEDNEILEKGETLTSEDDSSNDSDYEKDSFLVSSDEEDNALLSGSGDDLSMSDNELKMTPKSKKKYNERKLKEQKQASREMFESRHNSRQNSRNDSISKNSKKKKNTNQILDSSQSDDDVIAPKKNKRSRLNSTLNEGENCKSITESPASNQNVIKDDLLLMSNKNHKKEITLVTQNKKQNSEKPYDLSNQFVETDVGKDTSGAILSKSLSNDPLEDSNDDEDSSINNEDIKGTQNQRNKPSNAETTKCENDSKENMLNQTNIYDTSLQKKNQKYKESNSTSVSSNLDLNPEPNQIKKFKLGNHSLNKGKKLKKTDESIVDHLNLTQIKDKSRKQFKKSKSDKIEKIVKSNSDDSSDSIDLKLLFSEDSVTSGDYSKESKTKNEESLENIIPLKKIEAKTDIRISEDAGMDQDDVPFFVDTVGNRSEEEEENAPKIPQESDSSSADDSPPIEISYKRNKRDKKDDHDNNADTPDNTAYSSPEKIIQKTPKSDIKNKSVQKDSKTPENDSKKKIRKDSFNLSSKDLNIPKIDEYEEINENSLKKTPNSETKKVKKNSETNVAVTNLEEYDVDVSNEIPEKSTKINKKNKKRLSESVNDLTEAEPETIEVKEDSNKSPAKKTPISEKKKKGVISQSLTKSQNSSVCSVHEELHDQSKNKEKKDKKRNSLSQCEIDFISEEAEASTSESIEAMKNKADIENTDIDNSSSKKRKRKSSASQTLEVSFQDTSSGVLNETNNSHRKKRKVSQNSEELVTATKDEKILQEYMAPEVKDSENSFKVNNRPQNKRSKTTICGQQSDTQIPQDKTKQTNFEIQNTEETVAESVCNKPRVKKNKKRKNREDDECSDKAHKVLKEDSLDQIHIPRLPRSVLNNLEDKPNKEKASVKKQKAISTTEFVVEETTKKRNKPSIYLEESIYLNNDDHEQAKRQKNVIKKPKVLPFIPTATTSNTGCTTNFKVNVIPQTVQFVAQSTNVIHFKNDHLYGNKIKRLGTYDLYKKNRNLKMSKF
ncbi:dentin sialophosphoprotein-like isoform X2 [Battus philenor]|uniref:dentin sialophosphoprotein-like isoform X2 n=1 Tax=Battus philenor TaxID=42288 RepID=UPI0035CECEB7